MTRVELIRERNELSKKYREYEDKIIEMNKEIVRLRYRIDECTDKMCGLDRDIMAIDMCL